LAEGGEVTHYEVLYEIAKGGEDKKLASEVALSWAKKNYIFNFVFSLQGKAAVVDRTCWKRKKEKDDHQQTT
jgi:hypothetical protein